MQLREAQLLVGYRSGPLAPSTNGPADAPEPDAPQLGVPESGAPQPGDRAPDCTGLTGPVPAYPMRLLDILRGRTAHVFLAYASDVATVAMPPTGEQAYSGPDLETVAVLPRDVEPTALGTLATAAYRDTAGEFARLYRPDGATGFVVRPDGYLGTSFPLADTESALAEYLAGLT
ncbi:hypothetical protein [Streptomyces sp. NPDC046821]|uniref:hypothetical protein n=1 Tax=Streptomyces sp. NPDC046821 TaxID=3154702 RepID=UPI0033EA8678